MTARALLARMFPGLDLGGRCFRAQVAGRWRLLVAEDMAGALALAQREGEVQALVAVPCPQQGRRP